jgi:hypothetical protein
MRHLLGNDSSRPIIWRRDSLIFKRISSLRFCSFSLIFQSTPLPGIPGDCHATGNAAVSAVAAQPSLHGHHPGQKARRTDRPTQGPRNGGEEQPDGEPVFRVAGKVVGG